MIKGRDLLPKDVQECGQLLKGVILSLNDLPQPLSKKWVSPPQKEVIIFLPREMGPTS